MLIHWRRLPRSFIHLPAFLFFIAIAIVWSFPLIAHLGTHIPGVSAGDNVAFVWNFWWMREALAHADLHFFATDRLFAPFGINLTLYTHTALPAFLGATLFGRLSPIAAQNLLILASLTLNGIAAYLLAYDRAGDRGAAVVAGLLFAGSPFISSHLLGHFNLICAWGLPLFLLCFERALERQSLRSAIGAGLVAVAVAYTDYYYLVYCGVIAAVLVGWELRPLHLTITRHPLGAVTRRLLVALSLVDAVIVVAIVASGGFDTTIAAVRIHADRPTNPLTFGWVLLAAAVLRCYRPSWSKRSVPAETIRRHLQLWTPLVIVAVIGMAPLLLGAWSLWRSGTYVAPRASWRSGPGGIDLATFVLGNPLHPWSGPWTRSAYQRFGIDQIEAVGWMGIAAPLLAAWTTLAYRRDPRVGRWLLIAAAALVWALGPWLRIAGFNTGLLLPQNLFAYVPILSNARMPGRAIGLVFLALAVAIAVALSRLERSRRRWVVTAALILIAIDFIPAPFPLTAMDVPPVFAALRERRDGRAVCELPVGARDGFGSLGSFDDRALLDATIHGHPIVGGSTSRLPARIVDGYQRLPVVRSLFRLSGGESADPSDAALSREATGVALAAAGIGYIVLNRAAASNALVHYVEEKVPVELLFADGARQLYAVGLSR